MLQSYQWSYAEEIQIFKGNIGGWPRTEEIWISDNNGGTASLENIMEVSIAASNRSTAARHTSCMDVIVISLDKEKDKLYSPTLLGDGDM